MGTDYSVPIDFHCSVFDRSTIRRRTKPSVAQPVQKQSGVHSLIKLGLACSQGLEAGPEPLPTSRRDMQARLAELAVRYQRKVNLIGWSVCAAAAAAETCAGAPGDHTRQNAIDILFDKKVFA